MTVTTAETLVVNGVVLNTLAKNVESLAGRLRAPGLRTENITVPGRHGTLRTTRKMYEEGEITLPMWVRGTDDDGLVPGTQREMFFENVDMLTRLFRPGSGMLEVVHTLPDGSSRRVWAECTEVINFSVMGGQTPLGKFSVALRVPEVFWEDTQLKTIDLNFGFNGGITELLGTTAPIDNAIIQVVGPVTNPRFEALMDGAPLENPTWVQYSGTVAAGQTLTLDMGKWSLTGGGGFTVDYSKLSHSGGARWLTLVPGVTLPSPGLKFTGSNQSIATKAVLTARRKFLVG